MHRYHHMGIPTTSSHPKERYVEKFKMYTWGYETSEFHIQWHRYEKDCELPEIIQKVPHVAFQVDDMKKALQGKKVIVSPYFPIEGYQVAFIEEGGAPIEFIQTNLSAQELFEKAKLHSKFKS